MEIVTVNAQEERVGPAFLLEVILQVQMLHSRDHLAGVCQPNGQQWC